MVVRVRSLCGRKAARLLLRRPMLVRQPSSRAGHGVARAACANRRARGAGTLFHKSIAEYVLEHVERLAPWQKWRP